MNSVISSLSDEALRKLAYKTVGDVSTPNFSYVLGEEFFEEFATRFLGKGGFEFAFTKYLGDNITTKVEGIDEDGDYRIRQYGEIQGNPERFYDFVRTYEAMMDYHFSYFGEHVAVEDRIAAIETAGPTAASVLVEGAL